MQHEYHPDLSAGCSEDPQAAQGHALSSVFLLTLADKALLQGHLDDFQDADKGACAIIIERVMGQLYQLQPPNTSFDKKDASKVLSEPYRYGFP